MMISKEAEKLLLEIIDHESDDEYWAEKFEKANHKEDTILRGCFKELKENQLIVTIWADNIPVFIQILKDGYLYKQHKHEEQEKAERALTMSAFEKELKNLLDRAEKINVSTQVPNEDENNNDVNFSADVWMNDVRIFRAKYLNKHPLAKEIDSLLFYRNLRRLIAALTSISNDKDFIDKMNGVNKVEVPKYQAKNLPEYDVFISHANKDKEELIEELYHSLDSLRVIVGSETPMTLAICQKKTPFSFA